MPRDAERAQLEAHGVVQHGLAGRQGRQGRLGQIEQLRMGIVLIGQLVEQLCDVIAGVKTRQVAAGRPKAPQELRLGQHVQGFGRFAEEDYSTKGQEVKSRLERAFEPPAPLRQTLYLAKLAGKERQHEAGLAELHQFQHEGSGFLRRHRRTVPKRVSTSTGRW